MPAKQGSGERCLGQDGSVSTKPIVMLVTAEFWPLAKAGGLADMVYSIATSLRKCGIRVRVLLPGYRSVIRKLTPNAKSYGKHVALGHNVELFVEHMGGMEIVIVRCDQLYNRPGNIYQEGFRKPWSDNAQRFGVLCQIAAFIANGSTEIQPPDILHLQDWHAGLTPAYLDEGLNIPVVLTVQNFMFQGRFSKLEIQNLDLCNRRNVVEAGELFSGFSFLQAGLHLANVVTTVSPRYVKEIQAGNRFNWYYVNANIKTKLIPITNWPETNIWNPSLDNTIPIRYGINTLERRAVNRTALEERLNWTNSNGPILATLSRITKAKGFGFLYRQVAALLERGCRLVIVGEGDLPLVNAARNLESANPGRVALLTPYNETDARLVLSAADGLLMPSLTEPCGLSQQHAQLYGCVPLVARVGGMPDTVIDGVTGFIFEPSERTSFLGSVDRLLSNFNSSVWSIIQQNCMRFNLERKDRTAYADLFLRIHRKNSEEGL